MNHGQQMGEMAFPRAGKKQPEQQNQRAVKCGEQSQLVQRQTAQVKSAAGEKMNQNRRTMGTVVWDGLIKWGYLRVKYAPSTIFYSGSLATI